MIKFLLDAGVPRSVQSFLIENGYQAIHVFDVSLGKSSDETIYDYAVADQLVLVTRDKGFGNTLEYQLLNVGIIVIKDLNSSAKEIVNLFRLAWTQIEKEKLAGKLVIIDRNKVRVRNI
jgi:predicted nuclease of predicted toxin-antitoxin system